VHQKTGISKSNIFKKYTKILYGNKKGNGKQDFTNRFDKENIHITNK
jgi:hypothetical protein